MGKLNKLFLEDPEAFKKVTLTLFQVSFYNTMVEHDVHTSKQFAEISPMNIASISNNLTKLYNKGYLARKWISHNYKNGRGEYYYELSR